jgi:hypothetical protein
MNNELKYESVKIQTNAEYTPEYLDEILSRYKMVCNIDEGKFVYGRGHRKTVAQRYYEKLCKYRDKLSENVQIGVADEYIAVVDVNHFRSDMDCFEPLMEKLKSTYGFYPKYPTADAGYGSYNNYIYCYCQEHGMEKFMKFPITHLKNRMKLNKLIINRITDNIPRNMHNFKAIIR